MPLTAHSHDIGYRDLKFSEGAKVGERQEVEKAHLAHGEEEQQSVREIITVDGEELQ